MIGKMGSAPEKNGSFARLGGIVLRTNYHTHTTRCHHATGTPEEYIRCAVEQNFTVLGFADHSPYFFDGDYYSSFRMRPEELPEYMTELTALREAFREKIALHIGLEAEYYPAQFPRLRDYLRECGVEYLIMGQHFPGVEQGGFYSAEETREEERLRQYCYSVMEGLNTGAFSYLAHPDMCHFVGEDAVYTRYMRQLCREANGCGLPLEINLLGVRDNRFYPRRRFWEIAAEEGCRVILGYDAHDPQALANTAQVETALALVKELSLTRVEQVELRKI